MITSSGAEGISLKNTRYVHIMEPYWHPVRTEQVIGRARRICSHHELPKNLQNVKVYIYLATFSKEQLKSDKSIELRLKDLSKNVYTKLKDVVVNVDTGFRNPIFYPNSSNLSVNIPNSINNIHQI